MKLLNKLKERKTIVLEEPLLKKFGNPELSIEQIRKKLEYATPTKVARMARKLKGK